MTNAVEQAKKETAEKIKVQAEPGPEQAHQLF